MNNYDFQDETASIKTQISDVISDRRYILEPFTIKTISGLLAEDFHTHLKEEIYIQAKDKSDQFEVAAGISSVKRNGTVPLVIENQGPEPIEIQKGKIIAAACSILKDFTNFPDPPRIEDNESVVGLTEEERISELLKLVNLEHLTQENKLKAQAFLKENNDVFYLCEKDNLTLLGIEAEFELRSDEPIICKQYRLSPEDQAERNKIIELMIKRKQVEPAYTARYLSPQFILTGPLKNGVRKKKVCTDLRKINARLINTNYQYPTIQECIQKVGKNEMYSLIDIEFAFSRLKIKDSSREVLGFENNMQKLRFCVCPYGLNLGPSLLNSRLKELFGDLAKEIPLSIFFDDLCLGSQNADEAFTNLNKIFALARSIRLKFSPSKTTLLAERVTYLGFELSKHGIQPERKKVANLLNMKKPTNQKDTRKLLGFLAYYNQLIDRFAYHAEPLNKLLRKENKNFIWSQDCEDAFNYLRSCLCNYPVLAFPDPTAQYYLFSDCSLKHCGGILCQKYDNIFRPVAFTSKKLNLSLKRQTIYTLETFAIYFCLRQFAKYLCNKTITVYTDCKAVSHILSQKQLPSHIARYVLYISTFNLTISHIPGETNPSDFLSRIVCNLNLEQPLNRENSLTPFFSYEIIRKFQEKDDTIILIKQKLSEIPELNLKYFVHNNLLYKRRSSKPGSTDVIFAPQHLQNEIVRAHHDSPFCSHEGAERTRLAISQTFYWKNMRKTCTQYVRACNLCNYRRRGAHNKNYSITAMPRPQGPGQVCELDVAGPLFLTDKNHRYFLNIIDIHTKHVSIYPLQDQSAVSIAHALFLYICQNGCMKQLILDNYSSHKSEIFKELCRLLRVEYIYTTFYSKKSTAAVERSIRRVWDVLSVLQKSHNTDQWDELIPLIGATINSLPCLSTGYPPFTLDRGRIFRLPWLPILNNSRLYYNTEHYVQKLGNNMKLIFDTASAINKKECEKFTRAHNKKASYQKFNVHQLIYIYFPQLLKRAGYKDSLPWAGPYSITTIKRDKTIYATSLATNNTVKVHIERCKPYYGNQIFELKGEDYFKTDKIINKEKTTDESTHEQCSLKSIASIKSSEIHSSASVASKAAHSFKTISDRLIRLPTEQTNAKSILAQAMQSESTSECPSTTHTQPQINRQQNDLISFDDSILHSTIKAPQGGERASSLPSATDKSEAAKQNSKRDSTLSSIDDLSSSDSDLDETIKASEQFQEPENICSETEEIKLICPELTPRPDGRQLRNRARLKQPDRLQYQ